MSQQLSFSGRNHRDMLVAFYREYNAAKLDEVDQLLNKYKGDEERLLRKISKKYNLDPSYFGLSSTPATAVLDTTHTIPSPGLKPFVFGRGTPFNTAIPFEKHFPSSSTSTSALVQNAPPGSKTSQDATAPSPVKRRIIKARRPLLTDLLLEEDTSLEDSLRPIGFAFSDQDTKEIKESLESKQDNKLKEDLSSNHSIEMDNSMRRELRESKGLQAESEELKTLKLELQVAKDEIKTLQELVRTNQNSSNNDNTITELQMKVSRIEQENLALIAGEKKRTEYSKFVLRTLHNEKKLEKREMETKLEESRVELSTATTTLRTNLCAVREKLEVEICKRTKAEKNVDLIQKDCDEYKEIILQQKNELSVASKNLQDMEINLKESQEQNAFLRNQLSLLETQSNDLEMVETTYDEVVEDEKTRSPPRGNEIIKTRNQKTSSTPAKSCGAKVSGSVEKSRRPLTRSLNKATRSRKSYGV